ncbi:3-oxoacyl-(acyl-carrier protein) reductase [Lactococcus lactis subsp. lactis]|nr:3-oxoacyl-(acyl-carrier protein) reductase [Lactococcus lactis subsp. lactis]
MGKIEDVTNLVMFLLSEESSYIWGENIYINGECYEKFINSF